MTIVANLDDAPGEHTESYIRHALLFGDECVVETVYRDTECEGAQRLRAQIALALKQAGKRTRPPKRRRPTTPGLRVQVLELRDRGLVVAAIADTLNISDRRVREILHGAGYRRNGHEKRLVQAEKNAETRQAQVARRPKTKGA